jgi:hypothetical protein
MAFRIQDPISGLFWKVSGERIVLAETADEFTEGPDGLVNVFTAGNYVYSLPRPSEWKFTAEGFLTFDGCHFIGVDDHQKCPVLSTTPSAWVKVGESVAEAEAEEVEEPEPEAVAVPEPEPEAEEDVPVARSAALIEEALNAQAAAAAESEEEEA